MVKTKKKYYIDDIKLYYEKKLYFKAAEIISKTSTIKTTPVIINKRKINIALVKIKKKQFYY